MMFGRFSMLWRWIGALMVSGMSNSRTHLPSFALFGEAVLVGGDFFGVGVVDVLNG